MKSSFGLYCLALNSAQKSKKMERIFILEWSQLEPSERRK